MATRITNNLSAFVTKTEKRGATAVLRACIAGANEAGVLTPIDSSDLLNSQFKTVRKEGTKIVGTVGYTADYALPVHDPDNPQTFRRASAEKSFLTKGFERKLVDIDGIVRKEMKA